MGLMDQYKDMAQQAMQGQAGQGAPGAPPDMSDAAEMMEMSERYAKLAQSGIERKGKILASKETGRADVSGSAEYEFEVEITPDGGEPYKATILQFVHPQNVEHFPVGKELTVKVDPEDPTNAVLWG
jgi:hypothetical protein